MFKWFLGLTALLLLAIPFTIQAQDEGECDRPYADHFAAWATYLENGRQGEPPIRPEPGGECFDILLQAQIDAVDAFTPAPALTATTIPAPTIRPTPAPTRTLAPLPALFNVVVEPHRESVSLSWMYSSETPYRIRLRVTRDGVEQSQFGFTSPHEDPGTNYRKTMISELRGGQRYCFALYAFADGARSETVTTCATPLHGQYFRR